jgi:hypothetical protein
MPVKANPLAIVFRVLSGAQDSKFVFEPELRLFRLKIWLLSDDDDIRSLNESAALFASIMLRHRIRLDHKRSPKAAASELIDRVFKREDYRELYDAAFPPPRTPYYLSLNPSLKGLRYEFKKSRDAIEYLNQLNELRLRLHATGKCSFSLNEARDLDAKLKEGKRTKFARTNLSKVRHARQTREALLFVAKHYDLALLQFETKLVRLSKELREEAANHERFKNLFGRGIAALSVLKPKGLAAQEVHEWTQLDRIPLDVIKPFTKAEFKQIGFSPKVRRAAETTRVGKRQLPLGQVRKF